MPRFNASAQTATRTVNLAGGEAFVESPELEFASLVLTSMVSDQFYRPAEAGLSRMSELLDAVPPLFAAKAAVYARHEHGLRSISHVIAGELAMRVRGEQWTRPFYERVVRRPDDITEILSYVITCHGRRPLPNALKDGLARSFGRFDAYQLAKYRAQDKTLSLVDAVNLLHPVPTDRNREALAALVRDELRSTETWEAQISAAGEEDDVLEAKADAWAGLVASRQIGYFALLRNLRNIIQQAPDAVPGACEMLVDAELIRRSLVLPFRFQTAAAELGEIPGSKPVLEAISRAAELSLDNVPVFPGRTLVVVDGSGSMATAKVGRGKTLVADVAALFAAAIYKRNDADLMIFSTTAQYANVPPDSGMLGLFAGIRQVMSGGGTDFKPIFEAATQPYDRVVILSDMQGWVGYEAPTKQFEAYVARVGKRPHVFSFDLAGNGSLQFPERQVYCLAGFSDRSLEIMALLESDRQALVNRINAVEF